MTFEELQKAIKDYFNDTSERSVEQNQDLMYELADYCEDVARSLDTDEDEEWYDEEEIGEDEVGEEAANDYEDWRDKEA